MSAESLARQAEQLLGDGEVDERRVDVAVPEVGGEVGQPALRVDPLPVPLEHAVNDERVTQVVDAWSAPTNIRLETGRVNDAAQELLGSDVRVTAPLVAEQGRIGTLRESGLLTGREIGREGRHHRGSHRQAPRLEELGLANLKRTLVEPEIAQLESNDLAHPQAHAVAEDEHGVERQWTKRCVGRRELAGRAKQSTDLIRRIDVRATTLAEHGLLQHPIEYRRSRSRRVDPLQGSRQRPSNTDVLVLHRWRAWLCGIGVHQSIKRLDFSLRPPLRKAIEPQQRLLVALVSERAHALDVIAQRRTDAAAVTRQWSQARQPDLGILAEQGGHDRARPSWPAGQTNLSKRVDVQMARDHQPIEEGVDDLRAPNDEGPRRGGVSRSQP